MDIIQYEYTKQRRDFGHHPSFNDSQALIDSLPSNPDIDKQWIQSALTTIELDCIPEHAQHEVNTERFVQVPKGTNHTDGAWPTEIKTNEFVDRQRYLRRIMNETSYQNAVVSLIRTAESCIHSNNTIDLFEEYFVGGDYDSFYSAPPSAKTVCVFRDPNKMKRSATKISWHPDGANKLAVSYSMMSFQSMPTDMPLLSYIWDVHSPNSPDSKIIPTSPLSALVYNPRSPDHLVGGQYNGLVGFWDLRKGSHPVDISLIEKSHHDPVYDVFWVQSRTGNECCSLSTDGQLLWWDIRKLKAGPTDSMYLNDDTSANTMNPSTPPTTTSSMNSTTGNKYGGTALEYKSDAGATRYLVATEQGVVLLADRKAKKDVDSQKSIKAIYGSTQGQHHGPVYSVQRNPFNLKYFLTVGDWTARIWMEDLKAPIMCTRYDNSYLTAGCWSPSRPGVFLTTKLDGTLDIWDYYHKQSEPTFSTKVGEAGLSSIRIQNSGRLVACGSSDGSTTVLSLSRGLYEPQKDEKSVIAALFERETKREKNLELRYLQRKRDLKEKEKDSSSSNSNSNTATILPPSSSFIHDDEKEDEEIRELLRKAEEDFYTNIEESKNMGTSTSLNNTSASSMTMNSRGEFTKEREEEKEANNNNNNSNNNNDPDDSQQDSVP